jgi:hypothetical protein
MMTLTELKANVEALQQQIALTSYAATHALSKMSEQRVKGGALFYVIDGKPRTPLFCGVFVGPRVALTINHGDMFKRSLPFSLDAVASNGRLLRLECVTTNTQLDYSVLRLLGDSDSDAFFDLPSHSSVDSGVSLGLVSMGVGVGAHHSMAPTYSVHAVTVTTYTPGDAFFCYDGAATWAGDSGAALLFEEGCVVGMHLEVLDDMPEEVVSPSAGARGKRSRSLRQVGEQLDRVSVASGSHAKVCRALLLSPLRETIVSYFSLCAAACKPVSMFDLTR